MGWENPTGRESRKRWKSSLPGHLVKVKKAEILKTPCSRSIDSRSRTKNLQTARWKKDSQIGGNARFWQLRISDPLPSIFALFGKNSSFDLISCVWRFIIFFVQWNLLRMNNSINNTLNWSWRSREPPHAVWVLLLTVIGRAGFDLILAAFF